MTRSRFSKPIARPVADKSWPATRFKKSLVQTEAASGRLWLRPTFWSPATPGEELVGELLAVTPAGFETPGLTLRTETGVSVLASVVARSLIRQTGCPIGSLIRLVFVDYVQPEFGNKYRAFELFLDLTEVFAPPGEDLSLDNPDRIG